MVCLCNLRSTILLAVWLFSKATYYSKSFLILMIVWIPLQSVLGISGFYNDIHSATIRFPLLFLPPLLYSIYRFITPKGKASIDGLNIRMLTVFHEIRIPVEIVLFWLFVHKSIPEAMTFEGRNFDIFSGLSAPLVYYFGFIKKKLSRPVIITWNFVCIALLLNVASSAVLSLPARFQQFGLEQPNIAIDYFPILLLPAVLVPLALFANAAAIRQLLTKKDLILKLNQ